MGRPKNRSRFIKREPQILKLPNTIVGKLADQPILSIHDRRQIGLGRDRGESELLRPPEKGRDFGRTQDGLCRHTATQDAEPSERALVHNRHVSAGIARGPCRGIARRPAADDDDIVCLVRRSLTL